VLGAILLGFVKSLHNHWFLHVFIETMKDLCSILKVF